MKRLSMKLLILIAVVALLFLGITFALEKGDKEISSLFVGEEALQSVVAYQEDYSVEEFLGLVIQGKDFSLPLAVPEKEPEEPTTDTKSLESTEQTALEA